MSNIEENIHSFYHLIQLGEVDKAAQIINQIDALPDLTPEESLKTSLARQRLYIEVGDYDQTLEEALATEKAARVKDLRTLQFHALTHMIHSYLALAQYDMAQETIERAEGVWEMIADREKSTAEVLYADLENFKGLITQNSGDLESAMTHYKRSLTIREKYDLQRDIALTYFNIGSNYQAMKDMSLAIDFYNKALEIFKRIKYYKGMSVIYNILKTYYQSVGDDNQAFEYEQQMRVLDEKIDVSYRILSSAKEITRLSNELTRANRERIELEQKLWSLQFQLDSAEPEEASIPSMQIPLLEEEIEKLRESNMEIADLLNREQEKNEELEQKVSELEEKLLSLEDELKKRGEDQSKIVNSSKKITELNEALTAERAKVIKIETELANLKQQPVEKNEPENKVDLAKEEEKLRRVFEEKERELMKQVGLKEMNFQKEIDELKSTLEKREETIKTLELKVKNASESKNHKEELREEIQKLKAELKTQRENAENKANKIKELTEMKQRLEAELVELKKAPAKEIKKPVETSTSVGSHPAMSFRSSGPAKTDLENLLATSKLAQQLHTILNKERKIPLRFLAMRLGVSPQRCSEEIHKFEMLGAVVLEYNQGNQSNPNVILK